MTRPGSAALAAEEPFDRSTSSSAVGGPWLSRTRVLVGRGGVMAVGGKGRPHRRPLVKALEGEALLVMVRRAARADRWCSTARQLQRQELPRGTATGAVGFDEQCVFGQRGRATVSLRGPRKLARRRRRGRARRDRSSPAGSRRVARRTRRAATSTRLRPSPIRSRPTTMTQTDPEEQRDEHEAKGRREDRGRPVGSITVSEVIW